MQVGNDLYLQNKPVCGLVEEILREIQVRKIYVLQQQSTGVEIFREKVTEDVNLAKWEKVAAKKLLRFKEKELFWESIKAKDYIAAWLGKDCDKFIRTRDHKTVNEVLVLTFKEPASDNLTQEELLAVLTRIAKYFESERYKARINKAFKLKNA